MVIGAQLAHNRSRRFRDSSYSGGTALRRAERRVYEPIAHIGSRVSGAVERVRDGDDDEYALNWDHGADPEPVLVMELATGARAVGRSSPALSTSSG